MKLQLISVLIPLFLIGIFSTSQNSIFLYAQTAAEVKKHNMSLSDTIASIALFIAIIGLIIPNLLTYFQIKKNNKIKTAEFWLAVREFLITNYNEVHLKLRPNTGEWSKDSTNRPTYEEMPVVDGYLGFFEHLDIMLDKKLIDLETFKHIYKYRIRNILANDRIRNAKLIKEKASYTHFISLCKKLGLQDELPKD